MYTPPHFWGCTSHTTTHPTGHTNLDTPPLTLLWMSDLTFIELLIPTKNSKLKTDNEHIR